jgi:hypothetical protein
VRQFGWPSGACAAERVWLVLAPPLSALRAALNGSDLGQPSPAAAGCEYDVTELLHERNQLALELADETLLADAGDRPSLPRGTVRLEVRSCAWISELGLSLEHDPQPRGVVAGTILALEDGPDRFSLLVTADGREWLYADRRVGEFVHEFSAPGSAAWCLGTPNRLMEVEVALLAGGQALWQVRLWTAARPAVVVDKRRMAVGGALIPLATLQDVAATADPQAAAPGLQRAGTQLARASAILPEEFYAACDRLGLGIVQRLTEAAPRSTIRALAYHPSILAWSGGLGSGALEGTGNRPRLECLQ